MCYNEILIKIGGNNMSETTTNLKEQGNRFGKVIDFIKEKNDMSQNAIALDIGVSESSISKYRTGNHPIPKHVLDELSKKFGINPKFVRLTSDYICCPNSIMLNSLEKIVNSWDTVEKGDKKYLHLILDSNFYNFLLKVDMARLHSEETLSSIEEDVKRLDDIYSSKPQLEEYVLIPRNNFIEILQETTLERKQLIELIDFSEHVNYIED